jgi:hypothetical protein
MAAYRMRVPAKTRGLGACGAPAGLLKAAAASQSQALLLLLLQLLPC